MLALNTPKNVGVRTLCQLWGHQQIAICHALETLQRYVADQVLCLYTKLLEQVSQLLLMSIIK